MWEPWIGSRFSERKILLLGESCYDWTLGDEVFPAKPDNPIEVIEAVRADPMNGAGTIKKLTRAICATDRPTAAQSSDRWDCFAFTNYVPVSVGIGAHSRPAEEAWQQAEAEWPSVIARIKPRVIVVLGKGLWGYMPTTQEIKTKNVQAYEIEGSESAMCFAVQHPSFGPSWSVFADWIAALERYASDGDIDRAIKSIFG